jgi:hypothetical protein
MAEIHISGIEEACAMLTEASGTTWADVTSAGV